MKLTVVLLALVTCGTVLLSGTRSGACGRDLRRMRWALSADKAEAARAIKSLRSAGPAGLETLFSSYQAAIDRHRGSGKT